MEAAAPRPVSLARPRLDAAWAALVQGRVLWAWAFVAPTLIALLLVAGWPLLTTLRFSFTDASLLSLEQASWVGLANYLTVLRDPEWWGSVRTTVAFAAVSVGLETILGLIVALVLDTEMRARGLVRAAVLVPWAIPTVISAKIWSWMFNDLYGVINAMLLRMGAIDRPIAWLADPSMSFSALVLADVWKTTPFMALLLLAGLQLIPKEVDEAARLDSGSRVRTFLRITLPLLAPTLGVAVIFRTLDALRMFDLVYVLLGNNRSTATMTVYARQRLMEFQEFGQGSAVSVLIFVFIGAFTALYLRAFRPSREKS